ncbi:MAG: hypothetical protein LUC43_04350 [Burkholderiales bacterium]|nr:hypothetical protein [Burkholderiales bacterium]
MVDCILWHRTVPKAGLHCTVHCVLKDDYCGPWRKQPLASGGNFASIT